MESGSEGKAEVGLAIHVLEDLETGSAALHREDLQGFHPPDRTNLSPPSLQMLPPAQRGWENPQHPWGAHRDDKIPDLKRLISRQNLCPIVKLQACLSHSDKNKSPLKIE